MDEDHGKDGSDEDDENAALGEADWKAVPDLEKGAPDGVEEVSAHRVVS